MSEKITETSEEVTETPASLDKRAGSLVLNQTLNDEDRRRAILEKLIRDNNDAGM